MIDLEWLVPGDWTLFEQQFPGAKKWLRDRALRQELDHLQEIKYANSRLMRPHDWARLEELTPLFPPRQTPGEYARAKLEELRNSAKPEVNPNRETLRGLYDSLAARELEASASNDQASLAFIQTARKVVAKLFAPKPEVTPNESTT